MPETKAKTVTKRGHWSNVGDDRLIDLDLEIDNPEALEDLVRQVPANCADAHVEFKYDLRGMDVNEFTCVHGSHQHKAGFVMNVDGVRKQSAPVRRIGTFGLAVGAACAFSLGIADQVLTFRTRAWLSFAPPTCRMPLGPSQGISQADPGGRVTPRF